MCLIFATIGASGQETWEKGSVAAVLASKSASLFPVTRDSLEA